MGVVWALLITVLWFFHLGFCLMIYHSGLMGNLVWLHVIIQTYLYTGLFITGHDAMHGTVSSHKKTNLITGWVTVFLFAGMSFANLKRNHFKHHETPGQPGDPDYFNRSRKFWFWWFSFMRNYITIWQLLIMAVWYNLMKIWFSDEVLLILWILPAFLSTLQLFYFGTYRPHRLPHEPDMMPHRARPQRKNHVLAMLSCYFFGYHFEHHEYPGTPWWRLYLKK